MKTFVSPSSCMQALITFLTFLIIGGASSARSQTWQRIGLDNNDVCWHGESLIVVGDEGNIMRSDDNGDSWFYLQGGEIQTLYGIDFPDDERGFIVGANGTVLETTDGGYAWNPVDIGATKRLNDVKFLNSETGFIVGAEGTLFRTENGGETWLSVNVEANDLMTIEFQDSDTGFIAGAGGILLRTTDGGTNWNRMDIDTASVFIDIKVQPDGFGILIAAAFSMYRTYDAGVTWEPIAPLGSRVGYGAVSIDEDNMILVSVDNNQVGRQKSTVISSFDKGDTWAKNDSGLPHMVKDDQGSFYDRYIFRTIIAAENKPVVAIGKHGSIVFFQNEKWDQKTFSPLFLPFITPLEYGRIRTSIVDFIKNDSIGIIALNDYRTNDGSYLRTTDNGRTWRWYQIERARKVNGFTFVSKERGIATVANNPLLTRPQGEIFKTSGDGVTWELINQSYTTNPRFFSGSLQSPVENTAFFTNDSLLMESDDAGDTWSAREVTKVPLGTDSIPFAKNKEYIHFLHSLSATRHYVVYKYTFSPDPSNPDAFPTNITDVYSTDDGGNEWELLMRQRDSDLFITSLYFRTPDEGYIGGIADWLDPENVHGVVYRTTDGGETWNPTSLEAYPYGISFFTEKFGFIVGADAMVMKTEDGGETWDRIRPEPYFPSDTNIAFRRTYLLPDGQTMLLLGDGVILRGEFPEKVTSVPDEREVRSTGTVAAIAVLPNPAGGDQVELLVRTGGYSESAEVTLYDSGGRSIGTQAVSARTSSQGVVYELSIKNLSSGVYFITLRDGVVVAKGKLVISR